MCVSLCFFLGGGGKIYVGAITYLLTGRKANRLYHRLLQSVKSTLSEGIGNEIHLYT